MKSTSDLFQLIHSLGQTEKRYFKVFANQHVIGEKNNYVRLFEAIGKQKEYDEKKLRDEFSGENFMRQFHVAKNYLYQLILKSLRNYHNELSRDALLKNLMRDVEILYNKGLYRQCSKLLKRARKIASQHENYLQLLEILKWEKKAVTAGFYSGEQEKNLESIFREEQEVIGKLKNLIDFWSADSTLNLYLEKEGPPRDKEELEKFSSLIHTPLLEDEKKANSFQSKTHYFNIYASYHYASGNTKEDYIYTKKLIALLETNPEYIQENSTSYIEALHNHLIACLGMGKKEEVKSGIRKLRELSENETFGKSEDNRVRIFIFSYNMELRMLLAFGEFEKGLERIEEIIKGLEEFESKLNPIHVTVFYYNIAYLYIGMQEYHKALKWLNKILNDASLDLRQDILSFARILNILVHYEIGNTEILDYIIRSTQRFLFPRKRLHRFEKVLLSFVRKLPRADTRQKQLGLFSEMKKELLQVRNDPFEKKAFEYFDFISWLNSKIEGIPFAQAVREKSS